MFKTVTYNNNIYYLVVTPKDCLAYDSEGTLLNTFDFERNMSELSLTSDKKIKYGNAAFYEDSSNPVLALQFNTGSTADPTGSGLTAGNVYIFKFNFSLLVDSSAATQPQGELVGSAHSANKLLFTSDGTLLSVCDNFVLVPSTSTSGTTEWKKVYFGDSEYASSYTPTGFSNFSYPVLASFTTIIPNGDNSLSLCYLNFSTSTNIGNHAYKIFLGISDLDSGLNSSTENHNYEIGYFDLDVNNACYPEIGDDSNNTYYCASTLNINTFPYLLNDCLDNADALDKVFVNHSDGSLRNYVMYNNSVYSNEDNIRSSYRWLGDSFTAYIKRTLKDECFILINQSSLREQSIKIDHQIFNSVGYLESSIGYSNLNSKNKAHVIYADSDKYINILVLNCIESNN